MTPLDDPAKPLTAECLQCENQTKHLCVDCGVCLLCCDCDDDCDDDDDEDDEEEWEIETDDDDDEEDNDDDTD